MKAIEVADIDEMLLKLPKSRIEEVRDFIGFLLEKEKKRKAFEKRVLSSAKEPTIKYESVEDAVKAVFDEAED